MTGDVGVGESLGERVDEVGRKESGGGFLAACLRQEFTQFSKEQCENAPQYPRQPQTVH